VTVRLSEVRPGAYFDSVILMQLQRSLSELPGVLDAGVVMATPANMTLLEASDLSGESKAGPDDLLIVVKAVDRSAGQHALDQVDDLLARRRSRSADAFRPRSLSTALRQLPEASWVLISVPGRYAAAVAREALLLGRHVFLYSDNVELKDEEELKLLAQESGLLLMGPDCGTAIIGGVGLGFANRVHDGDIGLVSASGTGMQAVSARLNELGAGLSQGIGAGGRDLVPEIGAVTMHQGLQVLARDPATSVIALISKPPEPKIAGRLLAAASRVAKPVVVYFVGTPPPARRLGNLHFASSLSDAADLAAALSTANQDGTVRSMANEIADVAILEGYVRGLFSGGTLAYEFLQGLSLMLAPLFSNVSVAGSSRLPDVATSRAHTIVDMGDDAFTQGRLHPMIDNDLRLRRLKQEASDPEVALIVLDVVLGQGAHPDPASELAPAIEEALQNARIAGHTLAIAALLIGTESDPQNVAEQSKRLTEAGATVYRTTEGLLTRILCGIGQRKTDHHPSVSLDALTPPLSAVNVGLEMFHDSLVQQGARAVHVDWRPPAGGNDEMMALLARMKGK
jgi:FdrA protein